jgi:uncharacterized protein YjbJ (UPF0337 family)
MARYHSKDPLPGLFLIGVLCLGIGCFVRYKAWQADQRLHGWTRAEAAVGSVEPFQARSGRYGTRTKYAVLVRYMTAGGAVAKKVVLSQPPASTSVGVYYDPANPDRDPEPETQLRSVSSGTNVNTSYAFAVGGVGVVGCASFMLRRRLNGCVGTPFAMLLPSLTTEAPMGREDNAAGKMKQVKGKANDVMGAIKGDPAQQAKGKVQKAVGKVQSAVGKATTNRND